MELAYHRTSCTAPKGDLREPDHDDDDDDEDIDDDTPSQCFVIWQSSSLSVLTLKDKFQPKPLIVGNPETL